MGSVVTTADEVLERAIAAVERGGDALTSALDALPAPIYVTDAEGLVTHFNQACVGFTGREPAVGKDRWCVTWRLFTDDGRPLPHDRCPMAVALRERRAVRGVTAIAERPDGTRASFMPFPTPLRDAEGRVTGAVNMLIDVTEERQAADLRRQAARCRRLAADVNDSDAVQTLHRMAGEYEAKADALDWDLGRRRQIII